MELPQNIQDKVDELSRRRRAEKAARQQTKFEERKRRKVLRALRKSRAKELVKYASVVAKWLKEFAVSEEGRGVFSVCGRPRVFCASFWLGFPVHCDHGSILATLEILKDTKVFYCERYKSFPSHETFLGFAIDDGKMVYALFSRLHPEYLEQAAKAVESGEVWKHVENSLR